jgi:thermitase
VAATDTNDCVAPWSGYGEWVDVAAPGVNIYSTLPINDYGYKSGTSMAAAYVSGMAGLLFTVVSDANRNGFVNDEVRAVIENSCDKLDIRGIGTGRVNAFEAVNQLSAPK